MENKFKYWWLVLIKGIILIILAFFIFQHPVSALIGLTIYIGITLMFTGFLLIAASISHSKSDENWGWKLAEGIVDILFAFMLLSNPEISASVFPFVVGFWMMFYGIMIFAGSFAAKKNGESSWWMNLLGGILTVLFGYFITENLLAGMVAITFWIGTGVLIFGFVNISISMRMRKFKST